MEAVVRRDALRLAGFQVNCRTSGVASPLPGSTLGVEQLLPADSHSTVPLQFPAVRFLHS